MICGKHWYGKPPHVVLCRDEARLVPGLVAWLHKVRACCEIACHCVFDSISGAPDLKLSLQDMDVIPSVRLHSAAPR